MCVLCQSNPFVDWHALDAPATEPSEIGTAQGGTSNGTSVAFNQALVNQLDSGLKWTNANGTTAQTISYGFTTSSAFAAGFGEASGWSTFNEAQKTAVRQMMTLWDDLIAPSLVESTSSPNTADIKLSNTTSDIAFAHAYFPGLVNSESDEYDKISGSVWLNSNYGSNSGVNNLMTPVSGVYGFMAIMHEIGHSLGLDHGGNYNGGTPAYGVPSTGWLYAEDSRQFTIMSYFNASSTGANWGGKYAQTPMVYDIKAIQQMYGADYTTRAGNTIYGFNANAGNALYDFSQNTSPILTIWDGNGIDTIDLSGWSSASILNLTAGSYSDVNGMTKNLAIAYNVDIENATGGSGNDVITGNDLANILIGNGGNDTINGAGGNDTINGGTGFDILNGGAGDDTIYFDILDNLTLLDGGVGFDTLIQAGILITFDYAGHSFERLLNVINDIGLFDWTQQTDYYDVSGLYYEMDITYDNGTRSVTEYDVYSTEAWSEWTVTYDANGNVISSVYVPDDGEPPTNTAPSITSNGAGATAAANISENATAVTTVTATDANAGTVLTYSITGGADANKFAINAATGVLSFVSAPNYEAPTDASANNVYDVQVQVSDGELTDTQTIAVTVTNQNEAPSISSNGAGDTAAINVVENGAAVTTVTATDPDVGAARTYSIVSGGDAAKFTINATTGVLSFITAPNFDSPADVGLNNVYDVQVRVSDGTLTDTQSIAVTVTNQNEAPTITSNGAGSTATISVTENITAVTTVAASDPDAQSTRSYSIIGGADSAKFAINAATGVLSFVSAPNFEAPADAGANNVYDVLVQVSDGFLTDTQALAVTVTNQNEAPTITSVDGGASASGAQGAITAAALNVDEGTTAVSTVLASDPDFGAVLTYSITGGADASKFTINATTGALSFISAPDFEAPGDAGANNVYDVLVQVSDGSLTDAQAIEVTVVDVDDALIVTTINGTSASNVLTGTAGRNIMDGLAGNDTLAGLGGADELIGGAGTDTATYIASAESVNVSLMTGLGSGGDAEGDALATIENLIGSNFDDILEGNAGVNVLIGGLGIDTLSYEHALAGVTATLLAPVATSSKKSRSKTPAAPATDTLSGFENITGSNFNDGLTGDAGSNVLKGLGGNDTLNGGAGADTMFGGLGDDTYVIDNIGDIADETGGDGSDTIQTALTFSLATFAAIENLTLTGSAAIAGTGNALANVLTGNSGANILTGLDGNDTLNGGLGADTMTGGAGDDAYVIDNAGDIADETDGDGSDTIQSSITFSLSDAVHAKGAIENLTLTGTAAINGTGNALANVITGNNGNNILAGLGGADTLIGGAGTDTATYIASAESVNVSLMTGFGNGGDAEGDTLATIENLTGSNLNDSLEGNAGNNVLAGGLGVDTLSYEHALAGVTVSLALTTAQNTIGAGSDTISGFESLTGSALNDTLTGNTGNNILIGLAGNDTLNGGVGLDTMFGGQGNDIYVIDNVGDIADETGGDGSDTVQAALTFSLAAFAAIENLTLTGTAAINGTGNDLANVITGNSGKNILTGLGGEDTLNGGLGADTLIGGAGNDTYVVDNIGDVVTELANEGTDTVQSSIAFSLANLAFVENLTLTGASAINGTGNALSNVITGNNGNNILAGLGGADELIGGLGTDTATYVASVESVNVSLTTGLGSGGDAEGDTLAAIENLTGSSLNDKLEGNTGNNVLVGGAGIDTVSYEHATTGVTVSLAITKAQNTIGAGSDTISGFENITGSALNDKLTGSTLANILHGGAGDDILAGGTGADTFDFSSLSDGSDIITDFVTGTDHIDLADLLDSAGLGALDYATLITQGNLLVQTGFFATGLASNSATTLDTRIYIDADGISAGGPVLIATLEDTMINTGDFLV